MGTQERQTSLVCRQPHMQPMAWHVKALPFYLPDNDGSHPFQTGDFCSKACILCSHCLQLHRLGLQPQDVVCLLGIPLTQGLCAVDTRRLFCGTGECHEICGMVYIGVMQLSSSLALRRELFYACV